MDENSLILSKWEKYFFSFISFYIFIVKDHMFENDWSSNIMKITPKIKMYST